MTRGTPTFESVAHAEELWAAYSERFKRNYLKHKHKPMFTPMFDPQKWKRHHEYSLEGFAKFLKVKQVRLKQSTRPGFKALHFKFLRDIRDWENERPEVGLRKRAVDNLKKTGVTDRWAEEDRAIGRRMMGL